VSYKDLEEFFDPDLYLPIGGTRYRVESPTAFDGLRLRKRLLTGGRLVDKEEVDEIRKLLGDTLSQMQADGVKWPEIVHAGRTALLHYAVSAEAAQIHWDHENSGGEDPGNPLPPEPVATGA
jgi:hypothetical protein